MSYSDDLDWLASNLQNWKPGFDLCVVEIGKDGERYYRFPSICSSGITKREWLGRRAELQNKPSWEELPSTACWIAQDGDGEWGWFYCEPVKAGDNWLKSTPTNGRCGKGALLGDWRDTLERRPDMRKATPEIDTSSDRVQKTEKSMSEDIEDVLELAFWEFDTARGKSGEERICFKNKVRWLLANYGGRGEPEHDDDWHERGVLPPAGIRCEAEFGGAWELVYVVGRDSFDRLVIECADGDLIPVEATNFRPLRTERDELIEIILSCNMSEGILADAILAAGFTRKEAV